MPTPDEDFDPLANLESMVARGREAAEEEAELLPPSEPGGHWGTALELPISLDVLAAGPAPGETPRDLVARALATARNAPGGPMVPARPVRSDSPDYAAAPSLPYPFDLSDALNDVAIARLVLPPTNARDAVERQASALRLVREYESRHRSPLDLHSALSLLWRAAIRLVDVPHALNRPGLSRSALRFQVIRPAAHDFADALRIPNASRPAAFEAAGIPMPKDKKGRPKAEEGGRFLL